MKVIVLVTIFAAVNAGNLAVPVAPYPGAPLLRSNFAPAPIVAAPVLRAAPVVAAKTVALADADYDPNPQYSYAYDIQDALTGDSKNHFESRNGDAVQGSYSLVEADGTRRIVEYTADPVNGFNAVVHKEPLAVKTVAAPVAYSAPLLKTAPQLIPAKSFLHYSQMHYNLGNDPFERDLWNAIVNTFERGTFERTYY
ncbi:hypothetical protein FQR65_LT07330 [Abscondita terminalis]|nr:hypothetical protein FQR65_LT07330 [Abscondita terminalis]